MSDKTKNPYEGLDEYEVVYRSTWVHPITAYVYGSDKDDAIRQAVSQGIDKSKIIYAKFVGKYQGYGHI